MPETTNTKIRFVCPLCKVDFPEQTSPFRCESCGRTFQDTTEGYKNFLVVDEFAGEDDPDRNILEENAQRVCMEGYLIPLLHRLFRDKRLEDVAVLDVGCGTGLSIDLLGNEGFEAWGADSGQRRNYWHKRSGRERLVLAGGEALPFSDNSFDFIFCAGVIEHIGCEGDARSPSPGYEEKRLAFIRECVRVTKQGGYLNFTCPNKHFPFDLFHRTNEYNPFRFHWPWDPFLLSTGDFKDFFIKKCGCSSMRTLPIKGYWSGTRLKKSTLGRIGLGCAQLWFNTMGSWPVFRASFLNPWLSVLVRK